MHSGIDYIVGLIVCNGKRTCTNISKATNSSHDRIHRLLCKTEKCSWMSWALSRIARLLYDGSKRSVFIIDDTCLNKIFSRCIEGVFDLYNHATGRTERGLSIVILAWSNGVITIPISMRFWFSKQLIGEAHYKTKQELARDLLKACIGLVPYEAVVMDGLYCDRCMIAFCCEHQIRFETKIARNRVVTTPDGTSAQIQKHSKLRLRRNERCRTVEISWQGMTLFITIIKRYKNGESTLLYIVSNFKEDPKKHAALYGIRWNIETLIRTSKQSLGLQDCLSRKIDRQEYHIYHVFLAYALLNYQRSLTHVRNPEAVARDLRSLKIDHAINQISSLGKIIHANA